MKGLLYALAIAVLLLVSPCSHARQVSPLDEHWRFVRADVAAASERDFDDSQWDAVRLPHTWNARDGEAGGDYYRGAGWYRRELQVSPTTVQRYFLQFDGGALSADVWVNGQHAGHHAGGYTAFRFDVSRWLQPGRNVIAVRVDNAPSKEVAPLGGDFTVFGGLYRGVQLIAVDPAHIDLLDDGGPGVYVSADEVSRRRAELAIRTRVRNADAAARRLQLRLTLRDAHSAVVGRVQRSLDAESDSVQTIEQRLPVRRPHLWQGVRDPYLYTLSAELLDGATVVDSVTTSVGIRQFAIDADRGLLLNGQPYAVHGVNLFHSGRPGQGLAVSDAQIDEDFRILEELGATGLRMVHFQHPQRAYDDADRLGFVVWTEIPLNAAMDESDAFRTNLTQQLRELIKQNHNHAAVFIWGLGNEVYRSDAAINDLLADLRRTAKQLDPQRMTSYAHCCAADDDPMTRHTDLIGFNRYFGWYDKELTDIGPWADRVHALQPQRAMALSEYGAGASVLQQQDPPARPVPNSRWHPEQYQALFHEAYWPQIGARPYLWGSFVWVAFDLASAGRNEGDRPGLNDKGLVTYDRRTRKDAYYWYQANWSRRPMVHLANRRATPRSEANADIKVYTNTERVRLHVNGVALPEQAVRGRMAVWRNVALRDGSNRLRVTSDRGVEDSMEWVVDRSVKLNQVGFLPGAAKWAIVPNGTATSFSIVKVGTDAEVFNGNLSEAATWEPAQESVKLADFTALTVPGTYRVRVAGVADSYPFTIAPDAYAALNAASIKAFYFNRASTALRREHAGVYAREAGHADTHVLVHASAASPERPEGTVISAPKGWYDAGDYNKYVVNSGISTYTLLAAYEHFPAFFQQQMLNIPESGNGIPDLLNEALWNLEWMLSMQDPHDGGVYHKLTNKGFDGAVMPQQATAPRYVVQKTTAAALNFAAVMATASRIFSAFEAQRPGLSARMLAAAKSAWQWARAHPAVLYHQPPDIHTGDYGDSDLSDEFAWAAAELYITTKDDAYYAAMNAANVPIGVPGWNNVNALAWMSLAHHRRHLTPVADQRLMAERITTLATSLASAWQSSAYRVSLQSRDFIWGSNAVALNQAMMLIQGYRLNGTRSQLDAAQALLDYVLGRNATGVSMVTGFGTKSSLHPHHRSSQADGIDAPAPGFIAGGPNPGQQDRSACPLPYPSGVPAKSYLDHDCSYASNEVAINWNAPLVYVSAALQALSSAAR